MFYNITRWYDERFFFKKIEIKNVPDKCIYEFTEQVEKLTLSDFNILFLKNGLHLQDVFGDYKLSGYDVDSSQRLIMVVKKQRS